MVQALDEFGVYFSNLSAGFEVWGLRYSMQCTGHWSAHCDWSEVLWYSFGSSLQWVQLIHAVCPESVYAHLILHEQRRNWICFSATASVSSYLVDNRTKKNCPCRLRTEDSLRLSVLVFEPGANQIQNILFANHAEWTNLFFWCICPSTNFFRARHSSLIMSFFSKW